MTTRLTTIDIIDSFMTTLKLLDYHVSWSPGLDTRSYFVRKNNYVLAHINIDDTFEKVEIILYPTLTNYKSTSMITAKNEKEANDMVQKLIPLF